MRLAGHLIVSGPGLLERLQKGESVRFIKKGAEFDLRVGNSEKEALDFDVWIPLSHSDEITIETDAKDGESLFNDALHVEIEDPKGGSFALTVNVSVMKALIETFGDYLAAHEAYRKMLKNSHVRVKSA